MNSKKDFTLNDDGDVEKQSPSINMDTFCVAPFLHQSTKTDGTIKACCRAKGRIATVSQTDLVDAWNWKKSEI